MVKYSLFLLAVLFVAATTSVPAQTSPSKCAPMPTYPQFMSRWNERAARLTTGNWTIPKSSVGGTNLTQALDGPNLYLLVTHEASGCVTKVAVRSKSDPDIGMAALVAWIGVVGVLSPELSNDQRRGVLQELGIEKPKLEAGGSVLRGGIRYTFSETMEGNELTAAAAPR